MSEAIDFNKLGLLTSKLGGLLSAYQLGSWAGSSWNEAVDHAWKDLTDYYQEHFNLPAASPPDPTGLSIVVTYEVQYVRNNQAFTQKVPPYLLNETIQRLLDDGVSPTNFKIILIQGRKK